MPVRLNGLTSFEEGETDWILRAGAGGLTRAYLELPNVKQVIVIEEAVRYMEAFDVRSLLSCFSTPC